MFWGGLGCFHGPTVVQIKTEYVQVKNDFLALHGGFLEQQLVHL